jgi:hypothetical protein
MSWNERELCRYDDGYAALVTRLLQLWREEGTDRGMDADSWRKWLQMYVKAKRSRKS